MCESRWWIVAPVLFALTACDGSGEVVGARLEAAPGLACPGSEVTLSWSGDGDAEFLLVDPAGTTWEVKPEGAHRVKAEHAAAYRLIGQRKGSEPFEGKAAFELVQGQTVVELDVPATCGKLEGFDGLPGLIAELDVKGDPALRVHRTSLEGERGLVRVAHGGYLADLPRGQRSTVSHRGTPLNGPWQLSSPLEEHEAACQEEKGLTPPPSGLHAAVTVTCEGK